MTQPTQLAYLRHMHDALTAICEYTAKGRSDFFGSRLVQDAVIRNLEVVGEATKGLNDETKARASGVPWRRIAGMRDVLIHHYFGVDLDAVWQVVQDEVPDLLRTVERLISDLAPEKK